MRFVGLKNNLKTNLQLQLVTCRRGVCMTPRWQLEVKMNKKYIYAEIWGFRCGLKLGIGTLKIMNSTGVFVRVIFAL
jgi:hypothetical protein